MSRKKRAIENITISLILEAINIISGFVIPRLIIGRFGSATNGLIISITNFIGYVALLQSGVGSVIKASLYKPLAEKDSSKINDIVATLENFFKNISLVTIGYAVFLSVFFAARMNGIFDYIYTSSLVIIISFSTVAQYLWGMPYQILLEADQRGYIYSSVQGIAVLVNTIFSVILIKSEFSIQIVKLVTALVFIARPLLIRYYTIRKYSINKTGTVDKKLLKSRWDGFAQAIAFFIHSKTDIFVLTIFASFDDVSVYSIYALILSALTTLIKAFDQAVGPAFGNIVAKKEVILNQRFYTYRVIIRIVSTVLFGVGVITVSSFVSIYTKNIADYEYVKPVFGAIILSAEYIYCLRLPYNCIIYAAGKIKETRNSAIIEAIINIVLSVSLVHSWGMEGVAIATLIAMGYRTISLVVYLKNDVLNLDMGKEIKHFCIAMATYLPSFWLMHITLGLEIPGYFQWAFFASTITIIYTLFVLLANFFFDRNGTMSCVKIFRRL